MGSNSVFVIEVYTGDKKYAGTDANVNIMLYDDLGNRSKKISPNQFWSNNFERGRHDKFQVSQKNAEALNIDGKISKIEFWCDHAGLASSWYVDKITVVNTQTTAVFEFPFYRWVRLNYHYFITHLDTSLPQYDEYREQREKELEEKRKEYLFKQRIPGMPSQIKSMPEDEMFSWDYMWDMTKMKIELMAISKLGSLFKGKLKTLDDFNSVYIGEHFYKPKAMDTWKLDASFGLQRIGGISNSLIQLCTVIPDTLPVTDDMLKPIMEDLTIQDALDLKRLFICDLKILEGLPVMPNRVLCVPICLLFLDKKQQLRPVAIQLFQTPGPENPIFLPSDDPWLWTLAKMWYNNSDAACHQAHTHLGFTHLLMEGVAVTSHRQLSQSHPVFKLMAPHFLYLIAINSRAMDKLVSDNGWMDTNMNYGANGLFVLVARAYETWRLDVDGTLPEDLKRRRVDDPKVLPCYPFRDDAMLLYDVIRKYVTAYVNLYYDTPEKLKEDTEIQSWTAELVKERDKEKGGCGLLGVPGNGSLTSADQLVSILTTVIFTCSVSHAAANFGQYDEYGFPPNYPALLMGRPPTTKDALTEEDIMHTMPEREQIFDSMIATRILSRKCTNSLGDFEVQYIFDPQAIKIVEEFRQDLSEISKKIQEQNKDRSEPYIHLDPANVPNAISI